MNYNRDKYTEIAKPIATDSDVNNLNVSVDRSYQNILENIYKMGRQLSRSNLNHSILKFNKYL